MTPSTSASPLALVVDDEPRVVSVVRAALDRDGWAVETAADGAEADELLHTTTYDLVILDLGLPGRSGEELLSRLRARGSIVPVLILTGRRGSKTAIDVLRSGADDAVEKPFSVEELVARCRALVRRARRPLPRAELSIRALQIDPGDREATLHGTELDLTRREFDLLEALARFRNRTVERELLMRRIWGIDFDPGTNRLEVLVSRLRGRLAEIDDGVEVVTVPGVGYRLEVGGN